MTAITKSWHFRDIRLCMSGLKTIKAHVVGAEDSWLIKQQLDQYAESARSAVIGNVVNGAISLYLFANLLQLYALIAFCITPIAIIFWRAMIAKDIQDTPSDDSPSLASLLNKVVLSAISLGGFWGIAVGAMFYFGTDETDLFAGIIGAGMMSAGTISYRSIRIASQGYVVACVPGMLFGLLWNGQTAGYAAIGLLACYLVVLFTNARANSASFIESCRRERDLAKTNNTVQLLLNDFTEHGADWLVEVDRNGRICKPSRRLAEAASQPIESLAKQSFLELIDLNEASRELHEHFKAGRAFRRQIVSLTVNGEQRWWSITGRPVNEGLIAYRGMITDITAQRRAEEKVSYMAHYDGLTDLPNRFHFGDALYHALNRDNGTAGLMLLDLDHFKAINDTLGHPIGDLLLKAVARRLESCVSEQELVARLGGDEFAILVPVQRLHEIDQLAHSIVQALGKPFALGDHDVIIGTTIGIALAPEHGDCPDVITRKADLALYAAKAKGRSCALRFEPEMDEAAKERREIEMDLREALSNEQLRLHYQPIVEINTGLITGFEALIRWVHPVRGTVSPVTFIPIAEETGLIIQIGEWVIRQAIEDASRWDDKISVSINLSPSQMRSATLLGTLMSTITRNNIDPARICLEITESVLMQDSEANIQTLYNMRNLGVQIALDDFGTGYSSLNYLRSFPFSKIKIDRCFVSEIDTREDCQAIVRSVVGLANSLGMKTTAEGVEREAQVEYLKREGCGEVQGYLFSKALPLEELTDLRPRQSQIGATLLSFQKFRDQSGDKEPEAAKPRRRVG